MWKYLIFIVSLISKEIEHVCIITSHSFKKKEQYS